jgi:bacteriocin biosynthesis cyclodehydratase domain-containing protein
MLEIPALRPDLRREIVTPAHVVLWSDTETRVFEGELFSAVIARIDGQRRSRDIAASLAPLFPREEVFYALAVLEKRGAIVACQDAAQERAGWWYGAGVRAGEAEQRLAECPVEVIAAGIDPREFAAALREQGVRTTGTPGARIAIAADPFGAECRRTHRESLASGLPWMLVKPAGRVGWAGAVFLPGITACWECLRRRLEENHYRADPAPPATPLFYYAAAIQAALWVAGAGAELEGAVLTLDAITLARRRHPIARRPQCPDCGQSTAALPAPEVAIESRLKRFTADVGHRGASPAETRAQLERHVSPLTGVVCDVRQRTGHEAIPVFTATFNGPLGSSLNRDARAGLPGSSAGKGFTADQAWASCVAEALERYSVWYAGDEPCIRGSWRDVAAHAVHPAELTLCSGRQYETRETWNEQQPFANHVPFPFEETSEVEWLPAWSLCRNRIVHLPAGCALLDYRYIEDRPYCWSDSNGCASGNSLEEAILQGFLELVERDAVSIWWHNRLRRPGIALESFSDPVFGLLRAEFEALDRDVCLLDLTTDLGIPCFAAVSWTVDGGGVLLGFGAHRDGRMAASRALTELQQSLMRSRNAPERPGEIGWTGPVSIETHPCLRPDGPLRPWHAGEIPVRDDLRDDVLDCAALVASRGMDLIVLNLTRPEIGFPVVRVAVPGLRPMRPRFAPGRLYDVPVQMGWLAAPLREEELNPVPMRL